MTSIFIKKKSFVNFLIGFNILIIVFFINNLLSILLFFYFYSVITIFTYKNGTLSDPRILLVGFFTYYSTFYSINVYITEISLLEINYNLVVLSLKYQLFALFIFVSTLNLITNDNNKYLDNKVFKKSLGTKTTTNSENLIFIILSFFVILGIVFAIKSGANTKIEANSSNPFKIVSVFSFWILTVIAIIRAYRLKDKMLKDIKLYIFLIIALVYMLATGERDVIFRIVFVFLLIYYDRKQNVSFLLIIFILLSIAILIPISQGFKAIFLTGSITISQLGLSSVFSNEFLSAGRNFYSLFLYGVEHDISYLFNDLIRATFPSIVSESLNIHSTTSWFGSEYRVMHGFSGTSGWGFTLIGEGYLIGDIFGVALVSFLYALIIGNLYNLRVKSIYWYSFYLLAFASSIYVLRADFANLLSQVFKIGGISVFTLFIIHKLFIFLKKLRKKERLINARS